MKPKKADPKTLSQPEAKLIERLRAHPELMERFHSLLQIAANEDGPLKTADEVEERLIQAMRRLGRSPMHQWANQAEERVTTERQRQDPTGLSRKKNAEGVGCLRLGRGARKDLVQSQPKLPAPLAPTMGSDATGAVASPGTGSNGLWLRTFLCPRRGKCPSALGV
jgi:hypothetical protein